MRHGQQDDAVPVSAEGRPHPLPEDREHGDHRLLPEATASIRHGTTATLHVTVRCPGCGRSATWTMQAPRPGQDGASLVPAPDLDALADCAVRAFRAQIPASCALALAEGVMEG